jgi:hypothetical protein
MTIMTNSRRRGQSALQSMFVRNFRALLDALAAGGGADAVALGGAAVAEAFGGTTAFTLRIGATATGVVAAASTVDAGSMIAGGDGGVGSGGAGAVTAGGFVAAAGALSGAEMNRTIMNAPTESAPIATSISGRRPELFFDGTGRGTVSGLTANAGVGGAFAAGSVWSISTAFFTAAGASSDHAVGVPDGTDFSALDATAGETSVFGMLGLSDASSGGGFDGSEIVNCRLVRPCVLPQTASASWYSRADL